MSLSPLQFIREVFRDLPVGAAPVVAGFRGDPRTDADWRPHAVNGHLPEVVAPDVNAYYSIASIRPDEQGEYKRRKEYAAAVHVIVVDDVGTNGKISPDDISLPPSFEIETSPDNSQYGYLLVSPVSKDEALPVINALSKGAAGDAGGQNAARWVRLPAGVNGKASVVELYGAPFPVTLHHWHPERRYSLRQIIEGLKLDARMPRDEAPRVETELPTLRALRDAGRILREELSRPGTWHIVCPWSHEHTNGDTTGTYYYEPHTNRSEHEGFRCNHGHCAERTIRDLRDALGVRAASAPSFAPPLDVFAYHDVPPLPLDCLPSVIRNFAADRAELIGCDPAAIALPALVICGAALPDSIQIQPKAHDRTWRESARLWAAVIGNPSSKKSPGLKAAAGPAFNINAKLAEGNARRMAEYEEAVAAHKKAKGDGPLPVRPPWLQLIVQDTTIEALADALIDNPRGVIAVQDELSEWIGGMDAYTGKGVQKDRPAWLQAFEGGPRSLNRVIRGRAVIPNWSTAIVGGIQPDVVRRLMGGNGTGDGLVQRFLVAGLAPAGPGVDREPDEAAAAAYRELVRHLFEIREEDAVVTLAPAAASVWRDYMRAIHGVADALSGGQEQFATHLGKWPGILARLLLVYHVIECAGSRQYPGAVAVSLASAEAVIGLARRYLLPHAASFYGTVLNERSHHQTAAKVADVILVREWQSFTSRDLAAQWKGWRGLDERYQAAVLAYLEMCNWITPSEPQAKAGRRPSDLYLVNPEAHQRFSELAERERERRARLRADWLAAGQA